MCIYIYIYVYVFIPIHNSLSLCLSLSFPLSTTIYLCHMDLICCVTRSMHGRSLGRQLPFFMEVAFQPIKVDWWAARHQQKYLVSPRSGA